MRTSWIWNARTRSFERYDTDGKLIGLITEGMASSRKSQSILRWCFGINLIQIVLDSLPDLEGVSWTVEACEQNESF